MKYFEKLTENKIVQDLFVWLLLYIIFYTAVQADNRFLSALFITIGLSIIVYVNNFLILPFLEKNKILFAGLLVLNAMLFTIIVVSIINFATKETSDLENTVNFFGLMILTVIVGSAMKLARDSFTKKHKDKEAELQLLKAQLNPHFLFNTLNNLYGLSVIKSDKLPDLMLKLSDLLRYSLYETKEQFVPLEKEIKYLENYISLEKIRLEDKADIQFNKTVSINTQKIAPMLLIVFVENAFKHLNKEGESKVIIYIESTATHLKFTCQNTSDAKDVYDDKLETGKSGIGLQNAKKRLELIYPNSHKFTIINKPKLYTVELMINYTVL